eukprot:1101873-Prymnesium_polylepis.1
MKPQDSCWPHVACACGMCMWHVHVACACACGMCMLHVCECCPCPVEQEASARRKLDRWRSKETFKLTTDPFYASCLCLRSIPVEHFLRSTATSSLPCPLPISSINEDRLLKEMGIAAPERREIEALMVQPSDYEPDGAALTEQQRSWRAIAKLVSNPPPKVGKFQQRTSRWLLRSFPHG